MSKKVRVQMLGIAILAVVSSILLYELAENTRDFSQEMNRLRTKRVF